MKMVRIIEGAYGHKPVGATHIRVKTHTDQPFALDDKEAARIVGLGIAEYVPERVATTLVPDALDDPGNPGSGGDNPPVNPSNERPDYSEETSAAGLRELGKAVGLTFPIGVTKAQMIEALDEYYDVEGDESDEDAEGSDEDGDDSDDEHPPTPDVEAPVI